MAATAMTTTPAATVRAAYSSTGFGKLNTQIVYRISQVFVRLASGFRKGAADGEAGAGRALPRW